MWLSTKRRYIYTLLAVLFVASLFSIVLTMRWGLNQGTSGFIGVELITPSKSVNTIKSLDSNRKVTVVNKTVLNTEIQKEGFWNEKGVNVPIGDYSFKLTATGLSIALGPSQQPYGMYFANDNKTPISSFGVNRDAKNNFELLIWLNFSAIPKSEVDFVFNRAVFTAIYDITHWAPPGEVDAGRIGYIENMHRTILRRPPLPLSITTPRNE